MPYLFLQTHYLSNSASQSAIIATMEFSTNKKADPGLTKIKRTFLDLSITKKMLLGYLPLSALTIFTAAYTLSVLYKLNYINDSVIRADISLINTSEKMLDHLLAREQYGKRYIILKTPELKPLFFERSEEFKKELSSFNELSAKLGFKQSPLSELDEEYNKLFQKWFTFSEENSPRKTEQVEEEIRKKQEEIIRIINDINNRARNDLDEKTSTTSRMGIEAFSVVFFLCLLSVLLGIGGAMFITHYISSSFTRLKAAISQISGGSFETTLLVKSKDEIGELTDAFGNMSYELKRLKKLHLDASPLTYLPGNTAIENLLEKKIARKEFFSFCYLDLDHFKAFNDRYGYARGSEVIKATANVVEQSVISMGHTEDFVGHIGGDDFVVITTPERHCELCETVISNFDEMIIDFYDAEDIAQGHIEGKTRRGEKTNFPIMTISIAVVTNQHRTLVNHIQVGELAADLKDYAKS
ncbi:MAG: sensor domain-containing diguanylate cyclase, partial [Deltaproteobacteria bacterium]|nr:sensor domain-containing diguanylate cyclase [Deltaproteobacteria bacterium]